MFQVLGNRTFFRLFSAQVFSLLGSGLMTVALALIAYELGGDRAGLILGTIFTLKMIAYVGFAPLASALTGKVPLKPLLIGLDLIRVGLAALLPFVDELWQVYLLVFLFQLGSAAFTPAFQSLIPEIVTSEKRYTEALSLSRLAYNLETMFSPVLAGLLLFVLVPSQIFFGTALTFIVSALLVFTCKLPSNIASTGETFGKRLSKGFTIYLRTPRLRGLLSLNIAIALVGSWVLVNSVVYSQNLAGSDAQTFTQLMATYGFGAIVGALSVPRLLRKFEIRGIVLSGAALLGGLPLLIFLELSLAGNLALWGALGFATSVALTPGGLVLTRSAIGNNRPAIFAAQFSLSHGGWLLTYPLAGWLGVVAGLEAALAIMTLGSLCFTAFAFWLWPVDDPLDRLHTHDENVTDHGRGETPEGPRHQAPFSHKHAFYIDDQHPRWEMGK